MQPPFVTVICAACMSIVYMAATHMTNDKIVLKITAVPMYMSTYAEGVNEERSVMCFLQR